MKTHVEWMKWVEPSPLVFLVMMISLRWAVPEFHWGMIIGLSLLWSGITIGLIGLWTRIITKN